MKIEYLFNDRFCRDELNNKVESYKEMRKMAIIASSIFLVIYILLLTILKYAPNLDSQDDFIPDFKPVIIFILICSIPIGLKYMSDVLYYNSKNARREIYKLENEEYKFLNKMIYLKNDPDIMMNVYQLLKNDKLCKSHVTFSYNEENRLIMDINLKDFDILQVQCGESLLDYLDKYQLQAYHELNKPLNSEEMYDLLTTKINELNLDLERTETYEDYRQKIDRIKNKNKEVIK